MMAVFWRVKVRPAGSNDRWMYIRHGGWSWEKREAIRYESLDAARGGASYHRVWYPHDTVKIIKVTTKPRRDYAKLWKRAAKQYRWDAKFWQEVASLRMENMYEQAARHAEERGCHEVAAMYRGAHRK